MRYLSHFMVGTATGFLVGALFMYFFSISETFHAYFPHAKTIASNKTESLSRRYDLKDEMRLLWTDHVWWTRSYLVSAVTRTGEKNTITQRLLTNQEEIGKLFAHYYDKKQETVAKLVDLLKQHILLAADLMSAAQNNDLTKFNNINKKWKQNGDTIALCFVELNPDLSDKVITEIMKKYLEYLTNIANHQMKRCWKADIDTTDDMFDYMIKFADILADGITKQFPDKF